MQRRKEPVCIAPPYESVSEGVRRKSSWTKRFSGSAIYIRRLAAVLERAEAAGRRKSPRSYPRPQKGFHLTIEDNRSHAQACRSAAYLRPVPLTVLAVTVKEFTGFKSGPARRRNAVRLCPGRAAGRLARQLVTQSMRRGRPFGASGISFWCYDEAGSKHSTLALGRSP